MTCKAVEEYKLFENGSAQDEASSRLYNMTSGDTFKNENLISSNKSDLTSFKDYNRPKIQRKEGKVPNPVME